MTMMMKTATHYLGLEHFSPEKMNSTDDTVTCNQNQDPNQQQTTTNSDSMTDFEKSKGNIHLHN